MHMAVEGPANTQLHDDDKHRLSMLNRDIENIKGWKKMEEEAAPKMAQIMAERQKSETEERHQLREKWLAADSEARMKNREREGEMARGGGGMVNGAPLFHPGMQQGMGMHPSPMYPPHHPSHPHPMSMYGRMQPMQHMQHPSMVGHPSATPAANGMNAVDGTNTRKRPSNTPVYEDQSKRMMMESSAANRYTYPQGTIMDPQNGYPVYPQYQMSNGGPYGMPYTTPSCAMQQQQTASQQQQPFPLLPPSTTTPSGVSHTSPNTSSSTSTAVVPPSVPSSSSSAPPSSQHDANLSTSKDDLDALSHPDNVEGFISGEWTTGNDLGNDLGSDLGDTPWTGEASTSTGGGPSSLPPPHSNGTNGVVLPPGTASAPHSNRMPTPGGAEEMGGAPSSSSTHASPLTASPYHPSPHQSSYALNGLMNHVSSVGASDNGHNGQSMPSTSHAPPRTPSAMVMGPPSDSSTPYPHMSHVSSLPHHLQSSFPMTTSSHTQPSLLTLPSSSLPPIHPHSIPQSVPPPAPPAKKSRSKKAAAPKTTPSVPQPPVQFPLNGMYGMTAHPSMSNQFAPPPGAVPSMPPHPSTAGMTPQEMAAFQQQQHYQMMMMRQHQMAMHMQQMQRQGIAAPPSSSAAGMLPSPQGGMMTAGGRMPTMGVPMGVPPGVQQMTSPSMMMTPQQQQHMMMQQHQRMQQMQQMRYMQQPYMDPQQQMAMQQHQMQQQQLMQQQQQIQQQQQSMQQPGSAGSGQGSPMVGGAPSQNGVSSQQSQQSVPSPFNGSHPQINSPAYTNQSAPFPFAGAAAQFHPMNSSQ